MEAFAKDLKTHLFICVKQKERKACCAAKGSEAWVQQLKDWVKTEGLKGLVSVSHSSCLGQCESGVTAVFYPQKRWLRRIEESDLESLKEMLKEYANQ